MEMVRSVERTNYPLTLSVDDLGAGFRLVAQVEAAIDPARVCAFMQAGLASLVSALERAPTLALSDLEVLPPDERQLLLHDWNDTVQPFPHDRCVHQLFEEQVARAPEAIALVFEDRETQLRGVEPSRQPARPLPAPIRRQARRARRHLRGTRL